MTFKVLTTSPFINGELMESIVREDRLWQTIRTHSHFLKLVKKDYWDFKSDIILLPAHFTMEDLIESAKQHLSDPKILQTYLHNLKLCQLVEIEFSLV
jgi:hypothetical protein